MQRDADFSSLAQLPQIYRQARNEEVRRQTLAQLGQGGQIDPMQLVQSGDMNLANLGIGILNREKEQARQAERDKVLDARADRQFNATQAYQNRSLAIQEAARGKPVVEKVKDASGNESLVQVFPDGRTRALTPGEAAAATGGAASGPNNPFAPAGKQTEGQANAGLYAGRMFAAEKVLRDPKIVEAATSNVQRSIDQTPIVGSSGYTGLGNYLQSEDYQKFDQAQRDFINAVLRRESGAVISQEEFDNARKQYFPRPGDSKEVKAQKLRNRAQAIRGIAGAAGPAWKAPATFDDAGEMLDRNGNPVAPTDDWTEIDGVKIRKKK
jgi:hypothetical protein